MYLVKLQATNLNGNYDFIAHDKIYMPRFFSDI